MWLKTANYLRLKVSRMCGSRGPGADVEMAGTLIGDEFVGEIAARAAFELAAKRAKSAVGARATTPGGGPKLILANRVAGTDDHAAVYR